MYFNKIRIYFVLDVYVFSELFYLLIDSEGRGRSTGSMVTNLVLGIKFSRETPAALRDGSTGLSLKFTHSKMLPNKKSITLATGGLYKIIVLN